MTSTPPACLRPILPLLLVLTAVFSASCASPTALRRALQDREAELGAERDAHAETYRKLQEALARESDLEGRVTEASMPVPREAAPPREVTPAFPELDEIGVGYGLRDGRVVISLPSAITFPSGKATLSEQGQGALDAVSRRLKSEFAGATFFVEGHTDSDPIAKSGFESNRALSYARAAAVHDYLVAECQVPDEHFIVSAHGQYRPVAANSSAEGKARNRRVEIVVHAADE